MDEHLIVSVGETNEGSMHIKVDWDSFSSESEIVMMIGILDNLKHQMNEFLEDIRYEAVAEDEDDDEDDDDECF